MRAVFVLRLPYLVVPLFVTLSETLDSVWVGAASFPFPHVLIIHRFSMFVKRFYVNILFTCLLFIKIIYVKVGEDCRE